MKIAAVVVAIAAILFVLIFVAGEERRKVQDDEEMIRQIAKTREKVAFVVIADGESARRAREELWNQWSK